MSTTDDAPSGQAPQSSGQAPKPPAATPPLQRQDGASYYPQAMERDQPIHYVCQGGETIDEIAKQYGIIHPDVITGHPENRAVFNHPAWLELQDPSKKAQVRSAHGWDFDADAGTTTASFAAGGHPGCLAAGTRIYIPALTLSHVLGATREQREGAAALRLQLRPASASPPLPEDWARLLAMELSLVAYRAVNREKGFSTKVKHKWAAGWEHAKAYEKKRLGTALGLTAITVTVGMSVGSGGLAPAALLAVGMAAWTTRKLVDFAIEREHGKELRSYYERMLFDEQGRVVSDPNRHFNLFQRHVERARADVDHELSQERLLTADAATAIRKCITHMRKAHELEEAAAWRAFEEHDGRFGTCDDVLAHAKHGMHLLHETDKFKNYLLPVITHLVWFLDVYGAYLAEWAPLRDAFEVPVLEFMRTGDHSRCEGSGSVVDTVDPDVEPWNLYPELSPRERRCMRGAVELGDEQRDKLWKKLTDASHGALACSYSPPSGDEETTVVGLCLRRARQRLLAVAQELQESLRLSKAWSRAFHEREAELESLDPWRQRYELFKRDLAERYDHPDLWTQAKHSLEHYSLGRTRMEKAQGVLTDALALTAAGLGGAYLGEVWSEVLVPGDNVLDGFTKKSVAVASKQLVALGISTGIPWLVEDAPKYAKVAGELVVEKAGEAKRFVMREEAPPKAEQEQEKSKSWARRDRTLLLPDDPSRFELARAGALQDELAEDESGKAHREAGLHVSKLFSRIERHLHKANDRLAEVQAKVAENGGQLTIGTCGDCYAYLEQLMSFHYELDKVERCLVGALSLVDDLLHHAYHYTELQDRVVGVFEYLRGAGPADAPELAYGGPQPFTAAGRQAGAQISKGRIERWFWEHREAADHERCQMELCQVCYGPAQDDPRAPRRRLAGHQDPVEVAFSDLYKSYSVSGLETQVHLVARPALGRFQQRARVRLRAIALGAPYEDLLQGEHEVTIREEVWAKLRFKPEARGRTGRLRLEPLEHCTAGAHKEVGFRVDQLPHVSIEAFGAPRHGDKLTWRWKVDLALKLQPPLPADQKKAHVRVKLFAGTPPADPDAGSSLGAKTKPTHEEVLRFRDRGNVTFTVEEGGSYYAVLEPVERCTVTDDRPTWNLAPG